MKVQGTYEHLRSIGSILVKKGKITEDELKEAINEQNRLMNGHKPLLGELLIQQGSCTEADVEDAMSYQNTVTLSNDDGRLRAARGRLEKAWAKFEDVLETAMRETTRDVEVPCHES